MKRVKNESKEELLRPKERGNKNIGIPFIVTYHPDLKNLGKLIQNNIKHLYADVKVRSVVTAAPFASFRAAHNLRSHLVRSKLYPSERKAGSRKCKFQRCLTCKNVQKYDTFSSYITKESFKINYHFDCNGKCLICLKSCKVCGKQYVGSTTERFRFSWNNYQDNQRKAKRGEDHTQKYFQEHFLSHDDNGLINGIAIIFFDKTDALDPTRREEFWRAKLKTVALNGLNIEG